MATVVDYCCKGPGLLSKVPSKHTRIAVIDDNDLRTKIIIQKKLPDVKIIERKDVNILKNMKDLNIVMNPPYDGRLHLEILNNVINIFPEAKIVNLSPIRWLEDPCAEYKKCSDFKKFSLVRSHIERLEKISAAVAENAFGIRLPYNLGLYTINEKGGWSVNRDPLLGKMIKKVIDGDAVKNHIVEDDMKGLCLLISLFTGGGGGRRDTMNTFSLRKDRCFFKDCYNEFTGKTYLEQRKKQLGEMLV